MTAYTPRLNNETNYGLEAFNLVKDNYKKQGKLENILQRLQKNHDDPEAIKKAGKELEDNKDFYFNAGEGVSPQGRLESTITLITRSNDAFASENYDKLKSELKDEDYAELIYNPRLPLCTKTDNEECNEFAKAANEFKGLISLAQNEQEIEGYIRERVKTENPAVQEEFARYGMRVGKLYFERYVTEAKQKADSMMYEINKGKPKLRTELLKNVINKTMDEAKEFYDNAEDEKQDFYDANIMPYHLAVLERVYKNKKKENPDDFRSEEDKEEDERNDKRAKAGFYRV